MCDDEDVLGNRSTMPCAIEAVAPARANRRRLSARMTMPATWRRTLLTGVGQPQVRPECDEGVPVQVGEHVFRLAGFAEHDLIHPLPHVWVVQIETGIGTVPAQRQWQFDGAGGGGTQVG